MERSRSDNSVSYEQYLKMLRMLQDRMDDLNYKKQCVAAEAAGFTPKQVMEVRKIFKLVTTSGDNVDMVELKELLGEIIPISKKTAENLLQQLKDSDTDGDGKVDFAEFITLMRSTMDSEKKKREEEEATHKSNIGGRGSRTRTKGGGGRGRLRRGAGGEPRGTF